MTEQVIIENEEAVEARTNIVENAQKTAQGALRLSLGAADVAREEVANLLERTQKDVNNILNRFIERGEQLESEGRKRIETTLESRRKQVDERVKSTNKELDKRIETILHSMNVPTKDDIDALSKKVSTLTRKVNALAKEEKKA